MRYIATRNINVKYESLVYFDLKFIAKVKVFQKFVERQNKDQKLKKRGGGPCKTPKKYTSYEYEGHSEKNANPTIWQQKNSLSY